MKKIVLILLFFSFVTISFANDFPAYKLYNSAGEEVQFKSMISDLMDADIVFFGELHDNPIAHWMELEITKAGFEQIGDKLILGAEMFEADNQMILNEYLLGKISNKSFENEMRLWPNYKTDYKPIVEFAKENKLKFVATNIPRRYASIVSRQGFEDLKNLSEQAKQFFAPLPMNYDPELECYKQMMDMGGMPNSVMAMKNNLPKAQSAKDATMAHFIAKNWKDGNLFIHYNGSYHSNNKQGIIWHLLKYNPDLKIKTITTILKDDFEKISEEELKEADYILVVPKSMTRTY